MDILDISWISQVLTSQISEKACARLSATTSTCATHHRKKSETLQANHPRHGRGSSRGPGGWTSPNMLWARKIDLLPTITNRSRRCLPQFSKSNASLVAALAKEAILLG